MPTPLPGPHTPPAPAPLVDGDLALHPTESEEGTHAFELVWEGAQVGRVELLVDEQDADVLWVVVPEYRAVGITERALRLVLDWGVEELGLARLEARVPDADRDSVRSAIRSGMRREGIARAARVGADARGDVVVLARVATDPPPDSKEGFIGILNATLPTKRAIAQGVLRDRDGRVLLCELTYKDEWDLPGGVVDPSESPAHCVVREVREELGLEVEVRSLLAVNWLPPWRGWTDATVFVFELALDDVDGIKDRATLQRREIRALHFADEEEWDGRVAAYNQRLLAFLATHTGPTAYLEDGLPAL